MEAEKNRIHIKICGLMREEDIACVNIWKPDLAGFVFAPASRRYITPELAKRFRRQLDPQIQAVGVFVNEKPELVAELLEQGVIQIAQLHGQENEAYIQKLRSLTGARLIQAFRVENREDVRRAEQSPADDILLDHGAGGTGESFDWDLLKEISRPYILAGGLDCGNIGQALAQASPWGVDVSSGVETDGKKDAKKIEAFIRSVRKQG